MVEARLANLSPRLIGMEACVGAHHLSRKLQALGHDARLMPAKYVRPYSKGQKNDFRDAEVGRPLVRCQRGRLRRGRSSLHRCPKRITDNRESHHHLSYLSFPGITSSSGSGLIAISPMKGRS
jgi:transposase